MKNKGFTLIELLAVILILGVITLIAVPTVVTIINRTKTSSNNLTINNIISTIESNCQKEIMKGDSYNNTYVLNNGNIIPSLKMQGNYNITGVVYVNNSCDTKFTNLVDENNLYSKEYTTDNITTISKDKKIKYQEVTYINGIGKKYIDTGIIPNENTVVEFKYKYGNYNNYKPIMGQKTASNNLFMIQSNGSHTSGTYGLETIGLSNTAADENIYTIKNELFKVSGTKNWSKALKKISLKTQNSIYLFAINYDGNIEYAGNSSGASVLIYYFKAWQNDVLVRDLIPVLDQAGTPCFFDKVSNTFFYNIGTGNFDYK